MFCTNCGAELPDDATYCTNCGQPVRRSSAPETAPAPRVAPQAVPSPPQQRYENPSSASAERPRRRWVAPVVAAACIAVVASVGIAVAMTMGGQTDTGTPGTVTSSGAATSAGSDGSAAAAPDVPVDASASTPIGNLVNGGYVCEDDDNVYYATPVTAGNGWYTNAIVRASKSGSDKQTIYTNDTDGTVIYHLNSESGRVIFTEVTGGQTLVRSVGTDGSDPQTLATADDSSLVQVYQGRVYYLSGGTLKVMDPDGGNQADVMSVGSQLWRVANDRIVTFASGGATTVTVCGLDGSNQRTFTPGGASGDSLSITNVIPAGDDAYDVLFGTPSEGGGYLLYSYDENGGNESLVGEANDGGHINRANPSSAGLILLYDETSAGPGEAAGAPIPADESIEVNGRKLYGMADSSASLLYPSYVDGYVYFAFVSNGANHLMRVPTSRGTAETVV